MNHVMSVESLSLTAAFLAGFAGSIHCLAMCGGISGALGLRARSRGASRMHAAGQTAAAQIGRLVSYALAGALIGSAAASVPSLLQQQWLVTAMRAAAGLVLIGAAVGVLSKRRPLAKLERLGARIWGRLAPLSRRIPAGALHGQFLLGMLWGWLPCGMVYSMLLVAALSGGPLRGAATMLLFGLGTLPAVFSAGMAGAQAMRIDHAPSLKAVLGSLLLACGLLTALAPFTAHQHSTAHLHSTM